MNFEIFAVLKHHRRDFEPPHLYLNHNARFGTGGMLQQRLDWCERNYLHSIYIAEFWNTLSDVLVIFSGFGAAECATWEKLEKRFLLLYASIIIIGVGSSMYLAHNKLGQQGGGAPMVLRMLVWIFVLLWEDPHFERRHAAWKAKSAYAMVCI